MKPALLYTVLKADLHLKSYHVSVHHALPPEDMANRVIMANWLLAHPQILPVLWITDEAHVYLNGDVTSQNRIYLGSEKPDQVISKPLHPKKVTIWREVRAIPRDMVEHVFRQFQH